MQWISQVKLKAATHHAIVVLLLNIIAHWVNNLIDTRAEGVGRGRWTNHTLLSAHHVCCEHSEVLVVQQHQLKWSLMHRAMTAQSNARERQPQCLIQCGCICIVGCKTWHTWWARVNVIRAQQPLPPFQKQSLQIYIKANAHSTSYFGYGDGTNVLYFLVFSALCETPLLWLEGKASVAHCINAPGVNEGSLPSLTSQ